MAGCSRAPAQLPPAKVLDVEILHDSEDQLLNKLLSVDQPKKRTVMGSTVGRRFRSTFNARMEFRCQQGGSLGHIIERVRGAQDPSSPIHH